MIKRVFIIVLAAVGVIIALGIGGYTVWYANNSAKKEGTAVLQGLSQELNSEDYCENGDGGKGLGNTTPWWNKIYLSQQEIEETVETISKQLDRNGYQTQSDFVEDSDLDRHNEGKNFNTDTNTTFWDIQGDNGDYSVRAQVGNHKVIRNCFEGFSDIDNSLNPQDYKSVISIIFTDDI